MEKKIIKLPPGPIDDAQKFQPYQFDENLGISPLLHKADSLNKVMGRNAKTIYEEIEESLRKVFENEISKGI